MNEEALKYSFELFKKDGYNGSFDDYKNLISTDKEALDYSHNLFVSDGYEGGIDEFSTLVGVKKKDDPVVSTSQEVATESITKKEQPATLLGSSEGGFDYESFINKTEEEAISDLQTQLVSKGYSVDEAGIGNALIVTDNITGEKTEIDLRPIQVFKGTRFQGDTDARAEEIAKVRALIETPTDVRRQLLSSNKLEDYTRNFEGYLSTLQEQYPTFNFEYIQDPRAGAIIRASKGGVSQDISVSRGLDDSGRFAAINKFINDNLTEEEASELLNQRSIDQFNKIEQDIKNLEGDIDISMEEAEADFFNRNYFKGLFTALEEAGINVPIDAKAELEKGTVLKESYNPVTGSAATEVNMDATDIENGIQKYFANDPMAMDAINQYNMSGIVAERGNKIQRAKKLAIENYYENLPNREGVKEDIRRIQKGVDDNEVEILANIELAKNDFNKMVSAINPQLQSLSKKYPDVEFSVIVGDDGQFQITSSQPIDEVNTIMSRVNAAANNYSALLNKSRYELEKINAKRDVTDQFLEAGNRNYSLVDAAHADFKNALVQMAGGATIIGGLVTGDDYAVGAARGEMSESREKLDRFYETKRAYDEAIKEGSFGSFGVRTFSEQAPNLILAIGTSGAGTAVGLSEAAVSTLVASQFGITSAGQKYDELTTRQEYGAVAQKALADLEQVRELLSEDEYFKQKYELERAIEDSKISSAQKTAAVIGTGLVEGLVTRYIGTVPNSIKVIKDLRGTTNFMDDILRSNYSAAKKAVGEFGKRTGGEIIEETSIDALTQINDYAFLGDQIDLSSLDDVAVTSIITSGAMNVPSTAYSTILTQTNVNRYKSKINALTDQITALKGVLADPDLTDVQRSYIHNSINNSIKGIAEQTAYMEADAMLLGAENIKEMITMSGVRDKMLKRAGVEVDDSYDIASAKIDNYLKTLNKDDAKKFMDNMNYIDNRRNEILSEINYDGAIERVFGDKGRQIAENLDPSLTPQQKYVEVYKQLRQEINDNAKAEYDAIQEQEARDIPDAQPAEGVQEVEAEVREPAVQEAQEVISTEQLSTPETFTHQTRSEDAIVNWANSGKVVGKNEDVNEFDSRIAKTLPEKGMRVGMNRQSPNFQKGGLYSNKINEGVKFVVVNKNEQNFIPSDRFMNVESFDQSRGISTLKPDARDISNFDLYSVNEDGTLTKRSWNEFRTKVSPEGKAETVGQLINRPVTLTKLGGSKLDSPIEGDMYLDGQQVVVEDENGNITEIGNVDEISGKTLEEIGIEQQQPAIKTTEDGNIEFEGETYNPDSARIRRDSRGNITSVTLDQVGKPRSKTFRGKNAEDAAYNVLLRQADQSTEIEQLLEQDEEFQNELRQAETAAKTEADQDTEQAAGEQGAEAYVAELKRTKESDPNSYWSVSEVSDEAAAAGTVVNTKDGSALVKQDGDIVGVFKKIGSKAKGVAQDLLKRAVAAGGTKLDNFVTGAKGVRLQEIYEKAGFRVVARTPFNKAYAPDGWTEADGTPDVVAMVYDPEGKLDIEEKTFTDPNNGYDQMIAYRDSVLSDAGVNVESEVQKLRDLFKAPDQRKQVDAAEQALSEVAPDVQIIVHDSEQAYAEATNEQNRAQKTAGEYNPSTKVIHINPAKANARTVAHEVFHAILLNMVKTDAEAQRLTKAMMTAVLKTASPELKAALENFASNYDQNIQNEEMLAELVGIMASEYKTLDRPTQSVIKRWLDRLAKMFGLKPFTDTEVIDVLNTIAGKIATGEAITQKDVAVISGAINTEQAVKRKQIIGDFETSYFEDTQEFQDLIDKNLVENNYDLATIDGNQVAVHMPDNMFVGNLNYKGNNIFKGQGGVFYTANTGNVWASGNRTAANGLAKLINESIENSKDGKGRMLLVRGTDTKVLSSTEGVKAAMSIVEKMVDQNLIPRKDFRSSLIRVGRKYDIDFSGANSSSAIRQDIETKFMQPDASTFQKRGDFFNDLITDLSNTSDTSKENIEGTRKFLGSQKRISFSKQGITEAIGNIITERLLQGLPASHAYAVVEVDGPVEVIEDATHPSYPYVLKTSDGSSPKLKLLEDRSHAVKGGILSLVDGGVPTGPKLGLAQRGMGKAVVAPRKQRVASEDVIRVGKESGISDAAIRQYLVETGLTLKQADDLVAKYNDKIRTQKQKAEGIKIIDNKVMKGLDRILKFVTSAKGYMPKSMQIGKETMRGFIEGNTKKASFTLNKLDKAMKKYKGEEKTSIMNNLERYLRGDVEAVLPDNIKEIAFEMRTHIDGLSQALINTGAVKSEDSRENILGNIGSYLTRSYEVYSNKNWKDKVAQEAIDKAKNYLSQQMRPVAEQQAKQENRDVETVLQENVDAVVEQLLDPGQAKAFINNANEASKKLGILKQRKDIPAELRALMGEYTSPAQNYIISVNKIATLAAQQKFLNEMKAVGQDVFFFNDSKTKGFTTQIAAEGSQTMNPLNGMYTSPEIAEALKGGSIIDINLGPVQPVIDMYLKAVGIVKYNKTILSPGTHAKNFLGNMYFMLANGYADPKDFYLAAKVVGNDLFNAGNDKLNERLVEYIEAGIINQSATLRDLKDMMSGKENKVESQEDFEKKIIKRFNSPTWTKVKSQPEKWYQAEDDYFKIVAYEANKGRYAKALHGKSFDQLTDKQKKEVTDRVKEIVKNTLPNYDRLPEVRRLMRTLPLTGTFISFHIEALRTAYNTVDIAFKEVADPKTRAIGIKRLTGIMSMIALKAYVLSSLGLGDDDDEMEEDVRTFLPPWSKNSDIVIEKASEGKIRYRDLSASDPWGVVDRALNAYMSGQDMTESLAGVMEEVVGPFVEPDILLNSISEAKQKMDSDQPFEQNAEILLKEIYKVLSPGALTSGERVFLDDKQLFIDIAMGDRVKRKRDGLTNELVGQISGYKSREIDLNKSIYFKFRDIASAGIGKSLPGSARVASSLYSKKVYKFRNGEIDRAELNEAYDLSNASYKETMIDAVNYYERGLKLGLSKRSLIESMKSSGFSSYEIRYISRGMVPDLKKKI